MTAAIVAVLVTAVVVWAVAAWHRDRSIRTSITKAIGGRPGADPIDEHRRLVDDERKLAEKAMAHSQLLGLSLDALTTGVIITDHTAKVLVRNRLASDLSRQAHEKTLVDAAAAEVLSSAVRGQRIEREFEIFGPPRRVLVINASPITAGAQIVGALAVIDDVTDHHRIDQTRRDFVANLGHELRTPVGAMSLLAEMIDGESDPATVSSLTERLLMETDRMTVTIDDLLELSRIESDSDSFDERIVVQDLIHDAVARTVVVAEVNSIEVGVVAPAEPIVLAGNRDQLLSALVNLVDNAVKYSDPGSSVSIRVRVDDDLLTISVQDTGRGIPARDLDRIFERFYRVDRSRHARTGGTGIGLSIVRHVALNHGGTVTVDSFEGEGSTFDFAIPLVAPTEQTRHLIRKVG